MIGEAADLLLRVDHRPVREHVELAFRPFLDRSLVLRLVIQLGRETRGPGVVAVSDGAILDEDACHNANLPSDRLELLEGLAAAVAVADRAARSRPEDVLEPRLGRAAVRALERLAPQLDELRTAASRGAGGAKPDCAELLATRGRDPVGRPRVVEDHLDVGLGAELADPRRPSGRASPRARGSRGTSA